MSFCRETMNARHFDTLPDLASRFGNLTSMRWAFQKLFFATALVSCAMCAGAADPKLPMSLKSASKSKPGYWTAKVRYPEFGGGTSFSEYVNIRWKNVAGKAFNQFTEFSSKSFKPTSPKPTAEWYLSTEPQVSLARTGLVSGYQILSTYTGGAHPNTSYVTANFGLVNNQPAKLVLRDLLQDGVSIPEFLVKEVLPILNSMKRTKQAEPVSELEVDVADQFIITPGSITWVFSPYEVGSYAEGGYFVKVPFDRIVSYLDPNGPLRGLIPAGESSGPGTVVTQPNPPKDPPKEDPVLTSGRTSFSGSVSYLQRIALLPGSRLEILVVDRTKPDAPVVLLTSVIEATGVPIPFEFRIDTSEWTADTVVEAEFQIKNVDKVLFRSEKPLPLPKSGWPMPTKVTLQMSGADK